VTIVLSKTTRTQRECHQSTAYLNNNLIKLEHNRMIAQQYCP